MVSTKRPYCVDHSEELAGNKKEEEKEGILKMDFISSNYFQINELQEVDEDDQNSPG